MHTIVTRFNIIFLNTKLAHASDFTGPSSGSTLIVVVCNNYLTISLCIAYAEELVEFFFRVERICAAGRNVTQWSVAARVCVGVFMVPRTPQHIHMQEIKIWLSNFFMQK
jgi:hypothetical protein